MKSDRSAPTKEEQPKQELTMEITSQTNKWPARRSSVQWEPITGSGSRGEPITAHHYTIGQTSTCDNRNTSPYIFAIRRVFCVRRALAGRISTLLDEVVRREQFGFRR